VTRSGLKRVTATNRIQPAYVKQWGRSAVQQKQPNHNTVSENKNWITEHI